MTLKNLASFGLVLVALGAGGFGCELIAGVDRNKIASGKEGTGAQGGTGAASVGGSGGETGGGGQGGGGEGGGGSGGEGGSGGMPCMAASECPDPGNECLLATCENGLCDTLPVAANTPGANQTDGDCQISQCDGAGTLEIVDDDTDLPDDGNECTDDVCTSGVASNPFVMAGGACTQGGSLCDGAGACVECLLPSDCPGQDNECQARTCDAGVCGVMNSSQGTPVAGQTAGDCLKNQCDGNGGAEAVPDDLDVEDDGNDCTVNTCDNGTNVTTNAVIDTPCGLNGMLLCNGAGACVGCNMPSQCGTPANQCLDATCVAGSCGTADKLDGTVCDDGDACSQTDTCQAGACTGSNPVICGAQDQCHDPGTCDPSDGQCSNPVKTDGVACNDSNDCTQTDTCQAGACTGSNPVTCMAQDQCHDAGVCIPATGTCSNPAKMNGTACNDADACTQTDTCQAGTCTGSNPVTCMAQDQCHDPGVCNPANGVCSNPAKMNGAACNDSNACTQTDTCQAGTCTGSNPVTCMALDACHLVGTCNVATGICSDPNAPDGTMCPGGTCVGGSCILGPTCSDMNQNGNETDVDCGGGTCPPCANGDSCLVNGDCSSGHCVGNVCVQCVLASECPGMDNECQTRTCNSNACGFDFQPPGTPTPTQTAGDCKQVQCNGSGGTNVVNLDSDLPVDGNQCTGDVCTSGTPSNPALPLGTSCSQSGGTQCDGAGACVNPPNLVNVTPSDGAAAVGTSSTIVATFDIAMNPATLTAQTAAGACTGTIQVSTNDFSTCIAFTSATATMSAGNTVATLTPFGGLHAATTYRIRVTTAAQSAPGLPLGAAFTQPNGFHTLVGANACDGKVVISEVYGAGGNSGALLTHDFVELHNVGTTSVALTGLSLQYGSSAGNTWNNTLSLTGSIPAGGYFLVQLSGNVANGSPLPAPDQTGSISMAAGAGKIALVTGTSVMANGVCPDPSRVLDFVGYGAPNCFEGTGGTATLSTTLSAARGENGCADTNANNSDLTVGAPVPQNSASPVQSCMCNAVANELSTAAEADFCNLQFPSSFSVQTGQQTALVYGRIFENGTSSAAGAASNVIAELGWGPNASNPTTSTEWRWYPASFNVQVGNDDEYQQQFAAPAAGTYPYGYRFSFDGLQWTYCDLDGAGANAGLDFSVGQLGSMTVTP